MDSLPPVPALSRTLRAERAPAWLIGAGLLLLYLIVRLPHLRDMPVFCDEATYVRWAQLIRLDPARHLFISMQDAKLPLHYWLLALFYNVSSDPILSGRLFSVMCGAAMIPVLLALAGEMARLAAAGTGALTKADANGEGRASPIGRIFGVLAVLFMIFSPLLAWFQRMALAESLLLLEAVVLAWLSLRLARLVAERGNRWAQLGHALVLGAVWGATLLTKQNFSYLLWGLPLLAMACYLRGDTWREKASAVGRFLLLYVDAGAVGLLMFIPALFTASPYGMSVRLFYKPTFFEAAAYSRGEMALHNLQWLVWPSIDHHWAWWPYGGDAPLSAGALYVYLTPPVLALLVGGTVWLLKQRQFRPLAWLMLWSAALLVPLILNKSFIATRYVLLGLFPAIVIAGWIAAQWWERAGATRVGESRTFFSGLGKRAAIGALLLWPAAATVAGALDYHTPTLMAGDRMEYLYSSSAGNAGQQVMAWVKNEAARGPITLITGARLGIANDYAWITLRGWPRVRLLCTDRTRIPIATATTEAMFDIGTEQWSPLAADARLISLRGGGGEGPIYRIVETGPGDGEALSPAELARRNAGGGLICEVDPKLVGSYARIVATFANPAPPFGASESRSGFVVLRLDPSNGGREDERALANKQ